TTAYGNRNRRGDQSLRTTPPLTTTRSPGFRLVLITAVVPSSYSVSTSRRSNVQASTSTKMLVRSFDISRADVGTTSRDIIGALKLALANMPGLRRLSGLSNAIRTLVRRVS